jgi:penicillin-binding protein 2
MLPDKYKIKKPDDDDIKPEETLIDATSDHSSIEVPIGQEVFNSFFIFIVVVLALLVLKSFQMQIVDGRQYAVLADRSSASRFTLSSVRGIIYDANEQPLVKNMPLFDLVAVRSYLPKSPADLKRETEALASVLGMSKEDLAKIFEESRDKATFSVKRRLSKEEVVKIRALAPAGVYVFTGSQRFYPEGPATAHLLGYTAAVTSQDLKNDDHYLLNDRIGRLGLEAFYEEILRGEHRNFDLKERKELNETKAGYDLILNIDREIQKHLYQSLSSVFGSAGVRRGAAIIQNPKTGAVLGLVSMPSFDGNIFENPSEAENLLKIPRVLENEDRPLLNRVISGRYSPGSTIKPLLAMAGLKEGVITPTTTIYAGGSISVQSEVDPDVFYTFRDWRIHGWTDLKKAIADSVDVFFYALGGGYGNIKGLSIGRIENYLKSFLADRPTGIDLPGETAGFVPSEKWKETAKGESWYIGDTYNISIGQGDLLVTPLWLNTYIGSIANEGKLMKPFVVKEVKEPGGGTFNRISPQILGESPFDRGIIDVMKRAMRQTVLSGTAVLLNGLPVPVAAKTGTVQVAGRGLNSLFTVFGPYDDPEIVMTVLVENINQSQGLAVKVANDFLSWYFSESSKN